MSDVVVNDTKAPRVSVLLAAYNAEDTLAEALESIRAQDFPDWELIIIDDGSVDGTRKVAERFAVSDSRARVVTMKQNVGLPRSLNHALNLARGEYVARMDADDRCVDSRFRRQVAFLDARPDVAILGAGAYETDEDGEVISTLVRPSEHAELSALIFLENPFIHPTVMARRSALLELDGYDARLRRGQDYDLWLRAHQKFGMHNLPEPLIWYRRRRHPTWRDARYSAQVLLRALHREGKLWQAPWVIGRPLLATAFELLRPRMARVTDAA